MKVLPLRDPARPAAESATARVLSATSESAPKKRKRVDPTGLDTAQELFSAAQNRCERKDIAVQEKVPPRGVSGGLFRGRGRKRDEREEVVGLGEEREAPPPDRSSASVERRNQAHAEDLARSCAGSGRPERARRENSEVAETV